MNTLSLPNHVMVIADEDVWMEGEALLELARVAQLPGCVRAVGLPDLHPGAGFPLGASFAFADQIHPPLIGSDAGCGVRVTAVPRSRAQGDALERRVLAATEGPALPEVNPAALYEAA